MTNQEKKEILRSFRKLGKEIDRKIEEYERLHSWATKVTPEWSLQPKGGGGGDRISHTVEQLMELNGRINAEIDEYVSRREKIAAAVEAVGDANLRCLLGLYYLNGLTWEEVAERMNYSMTQIFRLHGLALQRIVVVNESIFL